MGNRAANGVNILMGDNLRFLQSNEQSKRMSDEFLFLWIMTCFAIHRAIELSQRNVPFVCLCKARELFLHVRCVSAAKIMDHIMNITTDKM